MAKCLVTGGAGFIGSHVVDALVARGDRVCVFDDLSTGKRENLEHHAGRVTFIEGDVRDMAAVRRAVEGIDFVFHLAAVRAVLRSVDDPRETNDINITGTLNVLLASQQAKVKRVVFSSSSAVYGETEKFPVVEDDTPNPQSPYAVSKITGEYYATLFSRLYGLEAVSLRYFNVFGPRQNPESKYSAVIPIFIDCLAKNSSPEIHWDGLQSRDFPYVTDVAEANVRAAVTPGIAGEIFNVACREEYSVLDIFNTLKKIMQVSHIEPRFTPKRAGDVRRTAADTTKAEQKLGFKPRVAFQDGLEKTVAWFLGAEAPQEKRKPVSR